MPAQHSDGLRVESWRDGGRRMLRRANLEDEEVTEVRLRYAGYREVDRVDLLHVHNQIPFSVQAARHPNSELVFSRLPCLTGPAWQLCYVTS